MTKQQVTKDGTEVTQYTEHLADGTLLFIENATQEQAATIVGERLGLLSGASKGCSANTPGAIKVTSYVPAEGAESALELPVLNFAMKTGKVAAPPSEEAELQAIEEELEAEELEGEGSRRDFKHLLGEETALDVPRW